MADRHADLDAAFIDAQRQRLEAMRNEALATQSRAAQDEQELQQEWQEPRDFAARGASATRQDVDDRVEKIQAYRLGEIERALEKIDEGSYGLSDESGEPIPQARLDAKPEALRTVEEEEAAARLEGG